MARSDFCIWRFTPMFCPNCGKDNLPGAVFCIDCGARLPVSYTHLRAHET